MSLNITKAYNAPIAASRTPAVIRVAALSVAAQAKKGVEYVVSTGQVGHVFEKVHFVPEGTGIKSSLFSSADLDNVLVSIIAHSGVVDANKYWFRLKVGSDCFVSFPVFELPGNHGALQWAYAESVSKDIIKGSETNLMLFCERVGVSISDDKKEFCFAKGHSVKAASGWTKAERDDFQKDIQNIIQAMVLSRGRGATAVAPKVTFLNS
jgi:hypothetical protein